MVADAHDASTALAARGRDSTHPSTASSIAQGYATVCRFFPGARERSIDDALVARVLEASASGKALCFEDQYAMSARTSARLSKKAVSSSSASTTKYFEPAEPRRDAEGVELSPMRNPGFRPAYSRIQASMLVVVVLPCVPDTASTHLSRSTCSASHCGPDAYARPEFSKSSTTG